VAQPQAPAAGNATQRGGVEASARGRHVAQNVWEGEEVPRQEATRAAVEPPRVAAGAEGEISNMSNEAVFAQTNQNLAVCRHKTQNATVVRYTAPNGERVCA